MGDFQLTTQTEIQSDLSPPVEPWPRWRSWLPPVLLLRPDANPFPHMRVIGRRRT